MRAAFRQAEALARYETLPPVRALFRAAGRSKGEHHACSVVVGHSRSDPGGRWRLLADASSLGPTFALANSPLALRRAFALLHRPLVLIVVYGVANAYATGLALVVGEGGAWAASNWGTGVCVLRPQHSTAREACQSQQHRSPHVPYSPRGFFLRNRGFSQKLFRQCNDHGGGPTNESSHKMNVGNERKAHK